MTGGEREVTEVRKEYIFGNTAAEIYSMMNEIVEQIRGHYGGIHDHKISQCRQVIVEMLTNGVKHSNSDRTLLVLTLTREIIEISKYDTGSPFPVKGSREWPLNNILTGEELPVYRNDLFLVYVVVESATRLRFGVKEIPEIQLNPDPSEDGHYGLIILVRASHRFTYQYNEADRSNCFRSEISVYG